MKTKLLILTLTLRGFAFLRAKREWPAHLRRSGGVPRREWFCDQWDWHAQDSL